MEDIIKLLTSQAFLTGIENAFLALVALSVATNGFILALRVLAKLTPWPWDDKAVDAVYAVAYKFASILTIVRRKK